MNANSIDSNKLKPESPGQEKHKQSAQTPSPRRHSHHVNQSAVQDEIQTIEQLLSEATARLQALQPASPSPLSFGSSIRRSACFHRSSISISSFRDAATGTPIASTQSLDNSNTFPLFVLRVFGDHDEDGNGYLENHQVPDALANVLDYLEVSTSVTVSDLMEAIPSLQSIADRIDFDSFLDIAQTVRHYVQVPHGTRFPRLKQLVNVCWPFFQEQQRQVEKKIIGNDRLIDPTGVLHFCWDIVLSLALNALVITIPLMIGWEPTNLAVLSLHVLIDFIFILDVFKNLNTAILDENNGNIIMDKEHVRREYRRGYFWPDVLGSVPVDLVFAAAGAWPSLAYAATRYPLKLFKFVCIFKLFRLHRFNLIFRWFRALAFVIEKRFGFRFSDGIAKLFGLFFFTAIIAHWSACAQFFLVRSHDFPKDSWVAIAGLQDRGLFDQWQWSYFKALTQMILIGFETPPFTNTSCNTLSEWCQIETWVTLLLGLFPGAIFFSSLIAAIDSYSKARNLASRQFEERMNNLDGFLRREKLSLIEQQRIKDDFVHRHPDCCLYDQEQVAQDIGLHRMQAVLCHRGQELADGCPVFANGQNADLLRALSNVMYRVMYSRGETIFSRDSHGDFVYFIRNGTVGLYLLPQYHQHLPFWILENGDSFGYELQFCDLPFMVAQASTDCILFQVRMEDWLSLVDTCPSANRIWSEAASERWLLARQLEHQEDDPSPNDDHVFV